MAFGPSRYRAWAAVHKPLRCSLECLPFGALLKYLLEASRGPVWGLLGGSWGSGLELSVGGHCWGPVWEPFWGPLGPSWSLGAVLGRSRIGGDRQATKGLETQI
eukprot:2955169-Pyramimonas_sp.AAC.1